MGDTAQNKGITGKNLSILTLLHQTQQNKPLPLPTPPQTLNHPQYPRKCRSPKGSYGLNQKYPWQKYQPTPTPSSDQIKQGSTSLQSPQDPTMPPKKKNAQALMRAMAQNREIHAKYHRTPTPFLKIQSNKPFPCPHPPRPPNNPGTQ